MAKNIRTYNMLEPLNGTTKAKVDINLRDGNLTIDSLTQGEPLLASGKLQYIENQGSPISLVNTTSSQVTLTVKTSGSGQPWFRFPWAACNGATVWQIHLNPTVSLDITAHSGGGNIKLDLTGMAVTCVTADTGGGNMEVVLPDNASSLVVAAKSGAGNVVIHIPNGIAARVHATSGLGKVILESRFARIDGNTYQSPDYERAAEKIEITASSGAGNVSVKDKVFAPEAVANRI